MSSSNLVPLADSHAFSLHRSFVLVQASLAETDFKVHLGFSIISEDLWAGRWQVLHTSHLGICLSLHGTLHNHGLLLGEPSFLLGILHMLLDTVSFLEISEFDSVEILIWLQSQLDSSSSQAVIRNRIHIYSNWNNVLDVCNLLDCVLVSMSG